MWVQAFIGVPIGESSSRTDCPPGPYIWHLIWPLASGYSQMPKFRCAPFPLPTMRTQSFTGFVLRFQNAMVMSPVMRSAGESGIEIMPVAPSRLKLPGLANFVVGTSVDVDAPGE